MNKDTELESVSEQVLKIPCYIDGKMIWKEEYAVTTEINGITLSQTFATDWMVEASIETATRVQNLIADIPISKIAEVLRKTMKYFFSDKKKYEIIVKLTGSPYSYVHDNTEALKIWCENLEEFYKTVFKEDKNIIKQTSPVVVILPSNSEEESIYVFAQTLLSRNATIVRPSSKNAGSYSSIEFVESLNKALDEIKDKDLEVLRSAISVLSIPASDYLPKLSIDGWNYIIFGDDNTHSIIQEKFRELNIKPKKIIAYGAGLSSSIIMQDFDFQNIPAIAESVSINRGNECISTDLIYVHKSISDKFTESLNREIKKHKSLDPFHPDSIGVISRQNISFIEQQAKSRGRHEHLQITKDGDDKFLHATQLHLHEYESAIEYPGPIVSIRIFNDLKELKRLILKDLHDNGKKKNLVTSVFTKGHFDEVVPVLSAYMIKHNKPTHDFDPMLPHQGIYLIKEIVDVIYQSK